jgi:hypothetical protein
MGFSCQPRSANAVQDRHPRALRLIRLWHWLAVGASEQGQRSQAGGPKVPLQLVGPFDMTAWVTNAGYTGAAPAPHLSVPRSALVAE